MRRTACVVLCLLASAISSARPAAAEPPPAATAAEWLVKGNEAFRAGRFAEAEHAYREAFAIKQGYDIAGNLGAAELSQGKYREAAGHLAFTLRLFPITGEPLVRERMAKAFEKARREVGAARVSTSVGGAVIAVDGLALGESPLGGEIFVEPGEHVFSAALDGFSSAPVRATVGRGQSIDVSIKLDPIVKERVRFVRDAQASRPRSLTPAIAMGSAGVVGISVGLLLLGASAGKRSSADSLRTEILAGGGSCVAAAGNHDEARCPELQSKLRAHDTLRGGAAASMFVGVAAAVGAGAYLLWPDRRSRSTGTLRVLPSVGERGSMVSVSGEF